MNMPPLGRGVRNSRDRAITVSGTEIFDPYAGSWVPLASPRGAELLRLKQASNVRELAARRWARNASTKPGTKRAAASNGGGDASSRPRHG